MNKKNEVINYFNEYLNLNNIDFVTFEMANINITLSASMKSLKEQAKNFIDKIADDLKLIDTQEHKAEILVEYKQTLNVSKAITTVSDRFKAIEEEKAKEEKEVQAEEPQKAIDHVPTVEEVEQVEFKAPIIVEDEKIYTVKFIVKGTLPKLKELKQFLEDGGYKYEQQ